MINWLQQHAMWLDGLALFSLFSFVLSLLVIPMIIVRLPANYFESDRRLPAGRQHPILRVTLKLLKNLLGSLLVLLGCLLLVLPGQGLLTLLLGLGLVDFPGKLKLQRRLLRQDRVLHSINWLRRRHGRAPLNLNHTNRHHPHPDPPKRRRPTQDQ
jgi:hypothetical protein